MPASDVIAGGQLDPAADPDKMEYFVPVEWADTVLEDKAINEPGMLGNRNTVCAPKAPAWRTTIERLRSAFPGYDSI